MQAVPTLQRRLASQEGEHVILPRRLDGTILLLTRIAQRGRPRRLLLVVDDDRDTRIAIRDYLASCFDDLAIELASYGAEAMRTIESTNVDLLLTDENMPGMRGTQLVQWTRERHPKVRCLMMSAENDLTFQEAVVDLDVPVFRKPLSTADLVVLVGLLKPSPPAA